MTHARDFVGRLVGAVVMVATVLNEADALRRTTLTRYHI